MKTYLLVFLTFVFFSCSNRSNEPPSISIKPSTLAQLEYPSNTGNSGDKVTSLLGYGYDATGFCDSTSARAKIIYLSSLEFLSEGINTGYPTLISANNFSELTKKLSNSEIPQVSFSGYALSAHLKSLAKLAFHTDSIDSKFAFSYYSMTCVSPRYRIPFYSDLQNALTLNFQNDINLLTSQQLVSKYGTHVLTSVILGEKYEVLYSAETQDATQAEHGLYQRMKEFMGGTTGIYVSDYEVKSNNINERMIYNSIGGNKKMCGIINPTDYNPDKLYIDIISSISGSLNYQFMEIGTDNDLIPLYDLIKDPTKKLELKNYIEQYIDSKTDMK
jgi:hypothetical protein